MPPVMNDFNNHQLADTRAQLEQLQQECKRAAAMTAALIAAFGEEFRREQRRRRKESDTHEPQPVLRHSGAFLLPLGVVDQSILMEAPSIQEVSATVLCSDTSEIVALRLSFRRAQLDRICRISGERVDHPDPDYCAFLIRLIAGEPKVLFEARPSSEHIELKVHRVGGAQCALRLLGSTSRQSLRCIPADLDKNTKGPSKGVLWKAQQLLHEGRPDRALEIATAYATERERPALSLLRATMVSNHEAEWLTHVNQYVGQFGLARIRLIGQNGPKFFRLDAETPSAVTEGPLVTVLMAAFNAERTLSLAAQSILKQSWTQLELIIVDDCSSDTTWEITQRIARSDPRVRVRRNSVNVGPYVSKNVALSMARGAYITCHDADDWAHPQRIEKQVEALLATNGRSPACIAGWLRFDESGQFTGVTRVGRQSDDGALQIAHVTCMLEADFMRKHVGYWDSVRFAADGEILERLELILGQNFLKLRQLAVLSLNSPQSLTNDPVHGISRVSGLSPVRRAYRDAWRQWHATLTPDRAYLPFSASRPFPAPDECKVPREALDLVRTAAATPEACPPRNSLLKVQSS